MESRGYLTFPPLSPQAELTGAVSELDALLPEMGCDSWVVAGVCEILPQSKSLGDLAGRYTF